MQLALALFLKNATSVIRDEFSDKADDTAYFLEIMNDYVIQPLLAASTFKCKVVKESAPFYFSSGIYLKCLV